MTTMIAEVYDALIEAGASEAKARKAAETIADYDARFSRLDRRLAVLTWQVGTLVATQVVIGLPALWLLARVALRVGALPG